MKYSVFFLSFIFLFSCSDPEKERLLIKEKSLTETVESLTKELKEASKPKENMEFLAAELKGVKAQIQTNFGNIDLEFFPEKAPLHVFTFVNRAESGFYDNTKFHRVIEKFMIQGGDPNTKTNKTDTYGQGGPLVMMPHEFNDIKHEPGILSTARVSNVNAGAGSQFFIMTSTSPNLDNQYTAFGKVTNGMDVVNAIAKNPVTKTPGKVDQPIKPVIIKTINVYR